MYFSKRKLIIAKLWLENNCNVAKGSNHFYLPYSSIYRILREYQSYRKASLDKPISKLWELQLYSHVGELIWNYWLKQKSWFTISDVADYLLKVGNIDVKYNILWIFMRNNLRLSFKKASSRPVNMNIQKQNVWKQAYILEFSSIVTSEMLLINIDEMNFSY